MKCVWFLVCVPLAAQTLKLDPLIAEALRANPEIQAAQKRYEAARQRPSRESSLPDPMLSLGYASSGNPLPVAGLGMEPQANVGFMVGQEMPFPGKRKLRGDIAAKEAESEFQAYQQTQLSVVSRVKQAYHKLHHAYAMTEVLTRNRDLLSKLLRITEARYAVGKAAQQDVFKAQTQLSILDGKLMQYEREKRLEEAELNMLMARQPGSPMGRPEFLPAADLKMTVEQLAEAAQQNSPMLRRDEKMIQKAELGVNLARKEYYPDYTLNAGYFNMGAMRDMYQFRIDVKLPTYFWRKQRAEVNEQSFLLNQSRRNFEASHQQLLLRIQDDYLMAQTSLRLMKLYSGLIVPQAGLAMESSLVSYETGQVDFLSLLMNLSTIVEYEMNYHEEVMSYHLALARLEEMTGVSVANWGGDK